MTHTEVAQKLREQGYDIRTVFGGSFDLFADRYYLLSPQEGKELAEATQRVGSKLNVSDYAYRRSGSDLTWFDFCKALTT